MIDIYEVYLDQKETIVIARWRDILHFSDGLRVQDLLHSLKKGRRARCGWLTLEAGKEVSGRRRRRLLELLEKFCEEFREIVRKVLLNMTVKEKAFCHRRWFRPICIDFFLHRPSLFCERNDTVESLCPCLIWQNSVLWTGCCDRNKWLRDRLFVLDIRLSCRGGRRSGSRVLLKRMVRRMLTRIFGLRSMERVQSILVWKWFGPTYGRWCLLSGGLISTLTFLENTRYHFHLFLLHSLLPSLDLMGIRTKKVMTSQRHDPESILVKLGKVNGGRF